MANQRYVDFATNSLNPYYVHANENPSMVLVNPVLDGKNYHTWARSIKVVLETKNKMKFLDGTIGPPNEGDALCEPWCRCNSIILSWI